MEIQEFSEKGPDVDAIKKEFNDAKSNLSFWMDKAEQGRECRFNEWAGKDESGKKNGPEAFPWNGASDLEANLINPLIDGDVALLSQSLSQANLVAAPVESGDIGSCKDGERVFKMADELNDGTPSGGRYRGKLFITERNYIFRNILEKGNHSSV